MSYRKDAEKRLRALSALNRLWEPTARHPEKQSVRDMYDGMRRHLERAVERYDRDELAAWVYEAIARALVAMEGEDDMNTRSEA